jgi:hypothetical protein
MSYIKQNILQEGRMHEGEEKGGLSHCVEQRNLGKSNICFLSKNPG